MNNTPEIKRLSDAAASIASTISEIIDAKLKASNKTLNAADAASWQQAQVPNPIEGWVGKLEAAQHFKISRRTVDNWMKRGFLPYIRIGRNVRFKLSEADEALNRRHKIHGRW